MAISQEQKESILADWDTGTFSNRELAKKYSVGASTVSRITRGIIPSNGTLVEKMAHTTINKKKEMAHFGTLNGTQQSAVIDAVNIKVNKAEIMDLFDNATVKNQKALNKAQQIIDKDIEDDERMSIDHLPNIIAVAKGTETNRKQILGVTETYISKEDGGEDDEVFVLR